MSHFGFLSFPAPGHLYPLTALGRRLRQRGHEVTFFQVPDAEPFLRAAGLGFRPIGEADHPPGSLRRLVEPLGRLKGGAAMRFTIQRTLRDTLMLLRDAPAAVRAAGVDALIVDQVEFAGGTVAEHLGLPFVTAMAALPLNRDDRTPSAGFPWPHRTGRLARLRNRLGDAFIDSLMAPVTDAINERRRGWGLPAVRTRNDLFSRRAQVAQLPAEFDFPGRDLPPHFHYTGPFTDAAGRGPVDFPWPRLGPDRPLVFASMGTLQNGLHGVFRTIAEACAGLGVRLVLSLGGGLEPEALGALPGDPVVVGYAPQLELIRRAALTVTHGGLNTVLESLAQGVPVVALPVTNDQPGVGARVEWTGTGKTIPVGRVTVGRLRAAVREVLEDPHYCERARHLQSRIAASDGLGRAAELIEQACGVGAEGRRWGRGADRPTHERPRGHDDVSVASAVLRCAGSNPPLGLLA
jgi:MGT family glycosyltransferase